MNITVLGAGAWGTALARLLQQGPHRVTLWGHMSVCLDEIRRSRRNERFLPGVDLPAELILEDDITRAIVDAECVVVAVPSQPFRDVTAHLKDFAGTVVSVTKGIEYEHRVDHVRRSGRNGSPSTFSRAVRTELCH